MRPVSLPSCPHLFCVQLGQLLSTLWPRIMGGQGLHATAPSLEGFVHLAPVLEEVMTGKADKETWDK